MLHFTITFNNMLIIYHYCLQILHTRRIKTPMIIINLFNFNSANNSEYKLIFYTYNDCKFCNIITTII